MGVLLNDLGRALAGEALPVLSERDADPTY